MTELSLKRNEREGGETETVIDKRRRNEGGGANVRKGVVLLVYEGNEK